MKEFNITGICNPSRHYMVDISKKLNKIKVMVDKGQYFTINRARQYGKTTTLHLLEKLLEPEYLCIRISFEGIGGTMFASEESFFRNFLDFIKQRIENKKESLPDLWQSEHINNFAKLNMHLDTICKEQKIVLMIDETDKMSNNNIFLYFIGLLRNKYLERDTEGVSTFHSVMMAGVYDIKNVKMKLRNEGYYTEMEKGTILNSPWNIASDFKVDMSFDVNEINDMLKDYEKDYRTGMDTISISEEIHGFTSGYPSLVSRICKCIDEEPELTWNKQGVTEAVRMILSGTNLLFDDIIKNLVNNKNVSRILHTLLMNGSISGLSIHDPDVSMCVMYGYLKTDKFSKLEISNKIFAKVMLDYFFDVPKPHY